MTRFNGHKNWNHWNVSLWINNDKGLYRMAQHYASRYGKDGGARMLFEQDLKDTKTPDGAPYSLSSVRAAMVDM